ncbi:amidohydrolase [Comamonas sp. GB3 AK4-5]|uniref:amidohydrolase family protein n=1 Tax=Comamonas sp. GB3 AK4-5 TaxID=3231487 RepID=UPI00351F0483
MTPNTSPPSLVIDSHAHVFLQNMPLAATRRHAPEFDATLEAYLALLDRHAVTHGVLVQPSFLGTDNRFMLDAMRRHPQRLRSVVMLDPTTDETQLAALNAQGVVGVRLNLVGLPLPDLNHAEWQTFLCRLKALDWHLELHRGAADLMPLLDAALHTGCRIVVDHFGRPDTQLAQHDPGFAQLLRRAASGRIWVKLSAAYRNAQSAQRPAAERTPALRESDAQAARACAQQLLAAFGPERLVWGSDWPHTQHQDLIDYGSSLALLADWVPDAQQRSLILGKTAAELFKIS